MFLIEDPNLDLLLLTRVNDWEQLSLVNRYCYDLIQSQIFWESKLDLEFDRWRHKNMSSQIGSQVDKSHHTKPLKDMYLDLSRRKRINTNFSRFVSLSYELKFTRIISYYWINEKIYELTMVINKIGDSLLKLNLQVSNYEQTFNKNARPVFQDLRSKRFAIGNYSLTKHKIVTFNGLHFHDGPPPINREELLDYPFDFYHTPSDLPGFYSYMEFVSRSKFFYHVIECEGKYPLLEFGINKGEINLEGHVEHITNIHGEPPSWILK